MSHNRTTAAGTLEQDAPDTPPELANEDRGLIFACYQTSIESQFAFLQTMWANHPKNPNGEGGHDPIIGQGDRQTGGDRFFDLNAAGQPRETIGIHRDWVVPTGGGFFFSPSISTIENVLGRDPTPA